MKRVEEGEISAGYGLVTHSPIEDNYSFWISFLPLPPPPPPLEPQLAELQIASPIPLRVPCFVSGVGVGVGVGVCAGIGEATS